MKIVLAGSPEISIKAFEEVIKNFEVVAVITQPDKPKGRGMILQETPVSALAAKYGIKTYKPEKISSIKEELEKLNYDLFLTFAFGQYIPNSILEQGKFKPLNIHGSLLPKYRGAAPIHYAILNGDNEIGISLMEMVKQMDAGDVFFKASKSIDKNTTTGDAFNIISDLAFENIVEWLRKVEAGDVSPTKQGDNFTLSPKIEKNFGELNNSLSIHELDRKLKGLNPFPGTFIIKDGIRIKIYDYSLKESANSISFECKDGLVYFTEYQYEGKKRIKT